MEKVIKDLFQNRRFPVDQVSNHLIRSTFRFLSMGRGPKSNFQKLRKEKIEIAPDQRAPPKNQQKIYSKHVIQLRNALNHTSVAAKKCP